MPQSVRNNAEDYMNSLFNIVEATKLQSARSLLQEYEAATVL